MQIKQRTRKVGIIKKCAREAKFHAYVSRSVLQRSLMYGGYDLPPSNRCDPEWAFKGTSLNGYRPGKYLAIKTLGYFIVQEESISLCGMATTVAIIANFHVTK